MFKPEGVYVAMMTIFDDNGELNEKQIRKFVDFQIEKGVDGIFPNSSLGEFVRMNDAQRMRLNEIVVEQSNDRVPVVPGVAAASADQCISFAKHAADIGCKAVVICPPYYIPISQPEIQKHFEIIADKIEIPVVLYNIPGFTQAISYETVGNLAPHPNIAGMKDSSGSMVDLIHFKDCAGENDFNMLTGREDMFLPALFMGAKGCMTGASGYIPEIMAEIYRLFKSSNFEEAKKIQRSFLKIVRLASQLPFPSGHQLILALRGFEISNKQPLSDQSLNKYNEIKKQLKIELESLTKLGLESFEVAYN
jgi:dihydrodipicolinate synthase/N-acetylneuraminate lyase